MYDLPTRDTRTFYLFKYVLLSINLKIQNLSLKADNNSTA